MIDKFIEKLEELESKIKLLNARTIELQAQIFALQPEKCEDPVDTLQAMEYELRFWLDQRGLPHTSADEVDLDKLSTYDVKWLRDFEERWDYHAKK